MLRQAVLWPQPPGISLIIFLPVHRVCYRVRGEPMGAWELEGAAPRAREPQRSASQTPRPRGLLLPRVGSERCGERSGQPAHRALQDPPSRSEASPFSPVDFSDKSLQTSNVNSIHVLLSFPAPDRNPENIKIESHLPHEMDINWEVRNIPCSCCWVWL